MLRGAAILLDVQRMRVLDESGGLELDPFRMWGLLRAILRRVSEAKLIRSRGPCSSSAAPKLLSLALPLSRANLHTVPHAHG